MFASQGCDNQGFNKNNCWGFQFHPEIDEILLNSMIDFEREELIPSMFVQNEKTINDSFLNNYQPSYFHTLLTKIFDKEI